jgi:hypothetical protein
MIKGVCMKRGARAALAALAWSSSARASTVPPPSDTPQDYAYAAPLAAAAKQGVLQLRLPQDVYLHARSPDLNDVRVFDASGVALPFALRVPEAQRRTSHRSLPLKVFPLMGSRDADGKVDLDVRTGSDGRLLSVQLRPDRQQGAGAQQTLSALILDLGTAGGDGKAKAQDSTADARPQIDALRFALPAGQQEYSAQVWLDTSDDLQHWDAAGTAELNWLANQQAQTLANDKLDFAPRRFRYARITWRSGTPLLFAGVTAEQLLQDDVAPYSETLLLQASAGKHAEDLSYAAPLAVPVRRIGLQFSAPNVVLPATLGVYRELPALQVGQSTTWHFEPVAGATFYRITQGGKERSSGDLEIAPRHAAQWVLRMRDAATAKATAMATAPPSLRISWEPASIAFLANGNAPYTLAVGRDKAPAAARELAQVAPGFNSAELQALEPATAAPLRLQHDNAGQAERAAEQAGAAARQRILILWTILLAGVGVLAFMVWRLLKQQSARPDA